MDGGEGIDTLNVTFWSKTYELNMNTGVTNYEGETAKNFENVNTGSGDDTITGTNGDNAIDTGAGNDVIIGGQRGDHTEIDRLTGGSGSDKFLLGDYHGNLYSVAGDNDYALITDFEKGQDTVRLDLESYTLDISPINDISGTAIYKDTELIGILEEIDQSNIVFETASFTTILKAEVA